MKVYFIGAGPGDPELITVKGRRLISSCPVCLYAGSLVPPALVACAPPHAAVHDTSAMHLDQILDLIREAATAEKDIARVHSGDPSLYGAIAEQIRRLQQMGIAYEVIPGVPAFAAAAAAMGQELTIPEVAQTVILTRTAMKSSPVPPGEKLSQLAATGATLAIHLSIRNTRAIQRELIPIRGGDCPVTIAYRVGWPDQRIINTDLNGLHAAVRESKITRTALILVGAALSIEEFPDSTLYDPARPHILRPNSNPVAFGKSDAQMSH
ncbi:MAG: precorrin-4 C(11)-methyltransferase [Rhodobacteraceae bacterium]|nr:precorrin-4 C(11)-methyltransferase [Paracoccaceae bacterium]MCY4195704.1 precorrin-4 C(11)-methyltransferase [Paracoccaceae bacterium]